MAKRFTDTDKWKKPFIRGLQGPYKLLWVYICDDCDHAGIWQVDFEVARIRIGEQGLDYDTAVKLFAEKIFVIEKFKWFIPGFIEFQYGKLSEANRAHLSVIQILKKYNLYQKMGLTSPLEGDKDKDKDKDKDMVKDMDKYITVDNEKVFDVLPILEFYEAALNGRQSEHKTRAWKDVLPEWFNQNLQVEFNDQKHVFNSFSKYLIGQQPKNGTLKKLIDLKNL